MLSSIAQLPREEATGVRWTDPAQWHVTLRFFPSAVPDEVMATLDKAEFPTAVATLGPNVTRLGDRVIVVPVQGLDELATVVHGLTQEFMGPAEPHEFVGHLTLGRAAEGATCPIVGAAIHETFTVDSLELIVSQIHNDGASHRIMGTWPLGQARLTP